MRWREFDFLIATAPCDGRGCTHFTGKKTEAWVDGLSRVLCEQSQAGTPMSWLLLGAGRTRPARCLSGFPSLLARLECV